MLGRSHEIAEIAEIADNVAIGTCALCFMAKTGQLTRIPTTDRWRAPVTLPPSANDFLMRPQPGFAARFAKDVLVQIFDPEAQRQFRAALE